MPTKPNKAGEQQPYVPAGNGDASGEYGNESGSNTHFQKFSKNQPNQINVAKMDKRFEQLKPRKTSDIMNNLKSIKITSKDGVEHSYGDDDVKQYLDEVRRKAEQFETFDESQENGGMTPERVAYDDKQVQEEINSQAQKLGQPKYEKKATFVLGLPASGKSFITDKLKQNEGAFEIDADLMKQRIPEFQKDVQMVSAVHEESSWMSKKMQNELVSKGANMIIGKVGGDSNYIPLSFSEHNSFKLRLFLFFLFFLFFALDVAEVIFLVVSGCEEVSWGGVFDGWLILLVCCAEVFLFEHCVEVVFAVVSISNDCAVIPVLGDLGGLGTESTLDGLASQSSVAGQLDCAENIQNFNLVSSGVTSVGGFEVVVVVQSTIQSLCGLDVSCCGHNVVIDVAPRTISLQIPFIVLELIVALGTSLPELAASIAAAFKKQMDISIGNIRS